MVEGIRNIIFDLGNVVIDINPQKTIAGFKKLGFTNVEEFLGHSRSMGFMADFQEGRMSEEEFLGQVRQYARIDIDDELIKDAWNAMLLSYDESRVEKLLGLKKRFRTFLFSNTNITHYHNFANRVPLVGNVAELFEKTFYSHTIGLAKPKPHAFEFVLKAANLKAGETLFLDDLPENVEAAKTVGMHARLVEYPNQWTAWL